MLCIPYQNTVDKPLYSTMICTSVDPKEHSSSLFKLDLIGELMVEYKCIVKLHKSGTLNLFCMFLTILYHEFSYLVPQLDGTNYRLRG